MKFDFFLKKRGYLYAQRNALAGLCLGLLVVVFLQAIFLFFKKQRILVVPPELKQSYWIEGNAFSPSYLEEMALYFSHLLLDVSPDNILLQGEVLLRYVHPSAYGVFKQKLIQDAKRLQKHQVSLNFVPREVLLAPDLKSVEVVGDLNSYVGHKRVSSKRETYRVCFTNKSGQLFLEEFSLEKGEKSEGETDEP